MQLVAESKDPGRPQAAAAGFKGSAGSLSADDLPARGSGWSDLKRPQR